MKSLLNDVREGKTAVTDALERLRHLPFEDMGFAKLDHHRALRTGMPEVIFSAGKTSAQVAAIFARMAKAGGNVLATRASAEMFQAVRAVEPRAEYHDIARAITLHQTPPRPRQRHHQRSLRRNQRPARRGRSRRHCAPYGQHS